MYVMAFTVCVFNYNLIYMIRKHLVFDTYRVCCTINKNERSMPYDFNAVKSDYEIV